MRVISHGSPLIIDFIPIILSVFLKSCKFHKVSLDDSIDITIHNRFYILCVIVGTMIFYSSVIKYLLTYLISPFDLFLSFLVFFLISTALFLLPLILLNCTKPLLFLLIVQI